MLEEAFSNATVSPSDAAQALLNFVRYELPAGGAAAEARFIRLFPLLCQRLFGPLQTVGDFRHEAGGWLSLQSRWDRPSSSTRSPHTSCHLSPKERSLDNDPVVQLLAGKSSSGSEQLPTLMEAISAETEHRPGVRFAFPFQALPKPTQDVMLAVLKSSFGGVALEVTLRTNASRLAGYLLRVHPRDQNELILYQQKKAAEKQQQQRPLQLSPGMAASPLVPSSQTKMSKQDLPPNIMLSMLEYYFISFVRYPLATPSVRPKQPQPQGISGVSNRVTDSVPLGVGGSAYGSGSYRKPLPHHGNMVYEHLLRGYLKHLLPHGRGKPPFLGFSGVNRDSELFLRIVIEFWLDREFLIPTTIEAATAIQERRQRLGIAPDSPLTLDASFDLINVKDYSAPPPVVQKCIRNLVNHLVSDPAMLLSVADSYETSQGRRPSLTAPSSSVDSASMLARGSKWCLSPTMTMSQQSFYNYVRMTLRHAPIHVSDSPFYTAMNAWLVWLEPWNVVLRKSKPKGSDFSLSNGKNFLNSVSPRASNQSELIGVVNVPKATTPSRYSPKWEPYIAANLHLYTVPLAIYLRRARELDFSSKEFHRSMKHVRRVFRVFSRPVVDTINKLLSPSQPSHPLSPLVAIHIENLGPFAPSVGDMRLSCCSQDMHTLLEEIYMQHMKTLRELDVFERFAARLEDWFSHGSSDEAAIKSLIGQARNIVDFPVDFIETQKKRSVHSERSLGSSRSAAPDKSGSGMLSERGRAEIISGAVKCNPMDIAYLGDKMASRPNSYELSFLVAWTIRLSNWLNAKFGFAQTVEEERDVQREGSNIQLKRLREGEESRKLWFRINLRFLADYRNIIFIGFLSWLLKTFRA